ncbi:branched-chain amino acid ABC transporter permease [Desulfatitalea tepidiphila]|uniref:branched-chain amino acid ABC transporter permease n=1 Tax=Desulfatitalea tepidiphila TaxID=1185843 RepID=UPI0006B66C0C|nr:branched-chain amino acid ABC transporter permease [Desulfatitalea tepidiphila]
MRGKVKKDFLTYLSRADLWLVLAGIATLLVLPSVLSKSWVSLLIEMMIMALAGCSLNLIVGYGGMVSFGPAGLYGAGAYTTAILLSRYGLPFPLAVLAAPIMAGLVGAVVGWFCVRRNAVYFALLTLAFSQIIWTVIFQWYDFTNGDNGIIGVPIPDYVSSITRSYYFIVVITLFCIFLMWRMVNSPFGITIQSIRENPLRSEFISVAVRRYQLSLFVVSSVFLGVSGALYCVFAGSVFPDYAHWAKSTDMLIVCLLGGLHSFAGPIVGSIVYIFLSKTIAKGTTYWMFYLGMIIAFLVLFMRGGIVGFANEKLAWILNRRNGARRGGER